MPRILVCEDTVGTINHLKRTFKTAVDAAFPNQFEFAFVRTVAEAVLHIGTLGANDIVSLDSRLLDHNAGGELVAALLWEANKTPHVLWHSTAPVPESLRWFCQPATLGNIHNLEAARAFINGLAAPENAAALAAGVPTQQQRELLEKCLSGFRSRAPEHLVAAYLLLAAEPDVPRVAEDPDFAPGAKFWEVARAEFDQHAKGTPGWTPVTEDAKKNRWGITRDTVRNVLVELLEAPPSNRSR